MNSCHEEGVWCVLIMPEWQNGTQSMDKGSLLLGSRKPAIDTNTLELCSLVCYVRCGSSLERYDYGGN
eukprot:gene22186-biopygen7838